MVDFFTRQERSRRATRVLIALFIAAVLAIVAAVTLVAAVFAGLYSMQTAPAPGSQSFGAWVVHNGGTLAVIAAITLAAIGLASFYRAATLAAGGGQVARMMGGTLLDPHSTDPLHRQLLNVTEEMAIASGVPVPEIYILEQEAGINAFAAGLATSNAAIAVTRGALEQLDRAELQGVVAHEFSHILNGDMRINQKLIGMSFGIVVLTLMGRWMLRAAYLGRRGRSGGAAAAAVAMGLALIVIGSIGIFFSRLIKAAVSRQREMLADASAVQFTRDPTSLAGALKKIGGYSSRLTAVDSEEIAHMLFARSSRAFSGLFATHPPLPTRIRALDPSFREGEFPQPRQAQDRVSAAASAASGAFAAAAPAASSAAAASTASAAAPVSALATGRNAAGRSIAAVDPERGADTLMDHAGEVGSAEAGCALRLALPQQLYDAAHERDDSLLLVLALAMSADDPARSRQLTILDNRLGTQRTQRCVALRDALDEMDPALRLPLLELTVPALRQRPVEQIGFLFDMVSRVSDAADADRLNDYILLKALAAYLPTFQAQDTRRTPSLSTSEAICRTLAAVAAWGHDDIGTARAAFAAGLAASSHTDGATAAARADQYLPDLQSARDLAQLDNALTRLAEASPKHRRAALVAILAAIRHDHRIEIPEVELFRAIAATLDCPLPPLAALTI